MPAVPFWDSVFKKIINRLTPFSEGGTYILQIGWFYCYKLFQHSRHFSQWLTQIFICSQVKSSERSFKAIQKVEVLVEREWNSCEIRDQHLEFILRVWRLQGAVEQRGKQPLVPKAKLDLLPWVGMEEVTVPQRAVCPAPITRDAKLRDAGSLSAPC